MGKKILVVEDEASIRSLYRAVLEAEGYEIDEAEEGQEGFRLATTNDYDLIISDLKMPNWDGVDAINSLSLVKPSAKLLVITGYIESDLGDNVKSNTCVIGMLSKPIDIPEFLDIVKSA